MPVRRALAAPLAALAALATAPVVAAPLAAQGTDSATFLVLVGNDTLAVERYRRTATEVTGELRLRRPAPTLVRYTLATARDGAATRLDLEQWSGVVDTTSAGRRVRVAFGRDSVAVTTAEDEEGQRYGARRGAAAYVNPSAALLEPVLRRSRAVADGADAAEVPLFVVPGGPVTARVRWHGRDSATVTIGATALVARLDAGGRLLRGWVPAQGVRMVRAGAATVAAAPAPPDYAPPPGAPYTAEEVRVPTPPGHVLAGTLTLPGDREGPVPVVVTISGSGPHDRDERIARIEGYRPFRQIADTLARRGIGVLRLDDRGTGASGGTFRGATSADFAADVLAALAWLRERDDVDPRRLAVLGHSEGGLVAPLVAAEDTLVRAVVLMAAPSRTGRRISRAQQRWLVERDSSLSAAQRARLAERAAADADSAARADRWTAFWFEHDPLPVARRLRAPVLVLQGETDVQITPDQADELAEAIRAAGNRDVTVRRFPDTNHLFVADPSGDPMGYAALPSVEVRRDVLGAVADWLARRLRASR